MSTADHLTALLALTFRDPRRAIRHLRGLALPGAAIIAGLALMAVAASLLLHLGILMGLMPQPADPMSQGLFSSPVMTAVLQGLALVLAVLAIRGVGAMFGGTGSLQESALVVLWLQAVLLAVQLAQFAAYLLLPPLAPLVALTGMVIFFWLLTIFVTEVHGFAKPGLVFLGILGTFIVFALLLSVVLAFLIDPELLNV